MPLDIDIVRLASFGRPAKGPKHDGGPRHKREGMQKKKMIGTPPPLLPYLGTNIWQWGGRVVHDVGGRLEAHPGGTTLPL